MLNATGVVLHTNLGRSPLSAAAREALLAAAGTVDVELDLATGRRGPPRAGARDALLAAVPEAEDALVVNNGAAALVLATTALASGAEVVVSRGELVEIGDGFRLPDLITSCGARLREVGTTNRTHLRDYADAVGPDTGAVLKVHPSNFAVSGFTSEVSVAEVAGLGVPVVHDIGSGLLRAHPLLPDEPDAATSLRAGAAVVTCSGDKLLGGPQAGLVLGRREVVERLRRHPLARALRPGKTTLAALEATLRGPRPPALVALDADPSALRARCAAIVRRPCRTGHLGGGGALHGPASAAVRHRGCGSRAGPSRSPRAARRCCAPTSPAVLARVEAGRTLVDPRALDPADDAVVAAAVVAVSGGRGAGTPGRRRADVAVVATAGHVDHGKSALVRALTGTDPDRLPEERRRGMTIELGHVWADVDGRRVAVVDVPGHDRLVGTTLAGPRPGRRRAARRRGRRGLERPDRGARRRGARPRPGHGRARRDQGRPRGPRPGGRGGPRAAGGPRHRAAWRSRRPRPAPGPGSTQARAALAVLADHAPAGDPDAPVRLWVDRSFTVTGAGTVVTGTLPTGSVARGGTLLLDGEAVRVRGLQVHHESVDDGGRAHPAGREPARRADRGRPPRRRAALPRLARADPGGRRRAAPPRRPDAAARHPARRDRLGAGAGAPARARTTPGSAWRATPPPCRSSSATGSCCATPALTRCWPARPCSTPGRHR